MTIQTSVSDCLLLNRFACTFRVFTTYEELRKSVIIATSTFEFAWESGLFTVLNLQIFELHSGERCVLNCLLNKP